MVRILIVSMMYDYGDPKRGISSSYYNDFLCLKKMGHEVQYFDYMTRIQEIGKEQMNEELLNNVKKWKPDLLLAYLYTDQFIPEKMDEIKKLTISVYRAFDDTWRKNYIDFWAPHFTYVTTSYIKGVENMQRRGINNSIYLSFACNHYEYHKKNLPKIYDVSFIGGFHPHRQWLIKRIEKSGVKVHVYGVKWKNGPISFNDMIDVINRSKINLNLPNEKCWDIRYLLSSPYAIRDTYRSTKNFAPINFRVYEINSCGGFQLLPYWEGIEERYEIGKELIVFQDPEHLVDLVKYYLKNDNESEAIAARGYERTMRDHTLEMRFLQLFAKIGLNLL